MSTFKKLLFTLIFILIIEAILIYTRYKMVPNKNAFNQNQPKSNYIIVVDTTSNILSVFKDGQVFKTYTVASGKSSTPSPTGTWKIVNKAMWGEGFGGHWMGFNVPWGKYGIHGTLYPTSIGWNSSHGCIRMKNSEVAELYNFIPYGTPVIIWNGPFGNFGEYLRTLSPGMIGSDIYQLQLLLKEKGYYIETPTGVYDEGFKHAIHNFQKDTGLPISDIITVSFYSKLGIYLID